MENKENESNFYPKIPFSETGIPTTEKVMSLNFGVKPEVKRKNWDKILLVLNELKSNQRFYKQSLDRFCENPTKENYDVFCADANLQNELEHKLHKLQKED